MSCKISIVSPVYRAEKIVPELVRRIKASVETLTMDYEIVLVEDCGPDKSWQAIQEICKNDKKVKGIKLSRNFGQHYAINAGLHHANGDWVIVMDCDLQDRPEEIPALYAKALEGFDVVQARRKQRQDTFFKRVTSKVFYGMLTYLTGTKHDSSIANFGIYSQKVIAAILSMNETIKYFPTMVKWVGFPTVTLDVIHAEREEGGSSYNLKRLLNLAADIILAYSDKPLRLTVKFGLIISACSFAFGLTYFILAIMGHFSVSGYASIIISIWFFSGIIILILGVIGLYIGKIFEGVKNRPSFIIASVMNE
jgi:glycosyltransferase involved in cell wall biosynthesis